MAAMSPRRLPCCIRAPTCRVWEFLSSSKEGRADGANEMFIGSVKALLTSSAALISFGGLGSEMRGGWTCWGGRKGEGRGQIAVGCQAMKKSCKGAGKQIDEQAWGPCFYFVAVWMVFSWRRPFCSSPSGLRDTSQGKRCFFKIFLCFSTSSSQSCCSKQDALLENMNSLDRKT